MVAHVKVCFSICYAAHLIRIRNKISYNVPNILNTLNAFTSSVIVNLDVLGALPVDYLPGSLYSVLDELVQHSTVSASASDTSTHPLRPAALFMRAIKDIAEISEIDKGT